MLSLNSPAFTALLLVMSLLRSPFAVRCLHLTLPLWKMVMELAFYLVINKFPGYVVLAAFVAALALLVYTFRITRVIALCLQGVSPFDEARYAAIDEYAHRMYRPDVSGASLVARDVAASPPFHGALAPAMSSSEACSSPRQSEGASEIVSSSFASPSVNGLGPLDRATPSYRPIVVGSVLVTNPNLISAESDVVLADLSFDELCQLEADEKAYASRNNMKIASDCNFSSYVAALSVAFVDGGVASGDAVVDDGCMDVFAGALSGGVAGTTASAGICFSSPVVVSACLVSVDAGNCVIGTKRSNEDLNDDSCVREAPPCKRRKTRFSTSVCGFCGASVLHTVARSEILPLSSCAVFLGLKRSRTDNFAYQEGKRIKTTSAGDGLFVSGLSGVFSALDVCSIPSSSSAAAGISAVAWAAANTTTAATAATATADAITHSTSASSIFAASALTATAIPARRIAIPRALSRRRVTPISSGITTLVSTITTQAIATPSPLATTVPTSNTTSENNEGECSLQDCEHHELEGFDLPNEDFNRIMNELDCEHDQLEGFDLSNEDFNRIMDELDREFH